VAQDAEELTFAGLRGRNVWRHPVPTPEQLLKLPASVRFAHAARALGYAEQSACAAVRSGAWPEEIPLREIGHGKVCLRADLLRYLGVADPTLAPAIGQ